MAGAAVLPFSANPITAGRVFPVVLTSEMPESLGFEASLGADSIWRLFYRIPWALPTGTGKILLACQANATSGVGLEKYVDYGTTSDWIEGGRSRTKMASTAPGMRIRRAQSQLERVRRGIPRHVSDNVERRMSI